MKSGTFTLSLDCEGLWGVADEIGQSKNNNITNENLNKTYDFIGKKLEHNNIVCTAAFVTCFMFNTEELWDFMEEINELNKIYPSWYSSLLNRIKSKNTDGLINPYPYKLFKSLGHEIGWHGSTHLPLVEGVSNSAIEIEINIYKKYINKGGKTQKTIIFPRNIIPRNIVPFKNAGFQTYRDSLKVTPRKKIFTKIDQFIPIQFPHSYRKVQKNSMFAFNPGQFLHWPRGIRGLVPTNITINKWKNALDHAVSKGGNVHMWFHPHNLITAPNMAYSFSKIIDHVGELIKTRDLKIFTIGD